jgi:excisionase family DNA binding protein
MPDKIDTTYTDWDSVPLLLTVRQTCQLLTVSRETFYRLIRSGELASRKIGRRRVVTKSALREFLDGGAS